MEEKGERVFEVAHGYAHRGWRVPNTLAFYCYRGDMFHHAMFCRRANQLLYFLGTLNDVASETTAFRLLSVLPNFDRVPDDLVARFRSAFTSDLPLGNQRLDSLIEESLGLAIDCFPQAEVRPHIARFKGQRRPAWDAPPPDFGV